MYFQIKVNLICTFSYASHMCVFDVCIGSISYYTRFCLYLSSLLQPLYPLYYPYPFYLLVNLVNVLCVSLPVPVFSMSVCLCQFDLLPSMRNHTVIRQTLCFIIRVLAKLQQVIWRYVTSFLVCQSVSLCPYL